LCLKITPDYGAFAVVVGVTTHPGGLESNPQGQGKQVLHLQGGKEEHSVPQQPKILLAILSKNYMLGNCKRVKGKRQVKERRAGKPRYSEMSKSGLGARAVKPEVAML
jgi:hypothetical protein